MDRTWDGMEHASGTRSMLTEPGPEGGTTRSGPGDVRIREPGVAAGGMFSPHGNMLPDLPATGWA